MQEIKRNKQGAPRLRRKARRAFVRNGRREPGAKKIGNKKNPKSNGSVSNVWLQKPHTGSRTHTLFSTHTTYNPPPFCQIMGSRTHAMHTRTGRVTRTMVVPPGMAVLVSFCPFWTVRSSAVLMLFVADGACCLCLGGVRAWPGLSQELFLGFGRCLQGGVARWGSSFPCGMSTVDCRKERRARGRRREGGRMRTGEKEGAGGWKCGRQKKHSLGEKGVRRQTRAEVVRRRAGNGARGEQRPRVDVVGCGEPGPKDQGRDARNRNRRQSRRRECECGVEGGKRDEKRTGRVGESKTKRRGHTKKDRLKDYGHSPARPPEKSLLSGQVNGLLLFVLVFGSEGGMQAYEAAVYHVAAFIRFCRGSTDMV